MLGRGKVLMIVGGLLLILLLYMINSVNNWISSELESASIGNSPKVVNKQVPKNQTTAQKRIVNPPPAGFNMPLEKPKKARPVPKRPVTEGKRIIYEIPLDNDYILQ